jgi:predicted RNase H-like nuclease
MPAPSPSVGIDGYRAGWVAVSRDHDHWAWATASIDEIGTLVPADAVVGIDMPIGLLESGERECDVLARQHLPGAAARVFMTPPRCVLELGPHAPNDLAQSVSRASMGKGVSRQALALGPRILALDAHLARHPSNSVIEVHPELSFAQMGGTGPLSSKKTARGVGQRLAVLLDVFASVADVVSTAPPDVPIDDALDALAALWSAQRWLDGTARTLPLAPGTGPFIAI